VFSPCLTLPITHRVKPSPLTQDPQGPTWSDPACLPVSSHLSLQLRWPPLGPLTTPGSLPLATSFPFFLWPEPVNPEDGICKETNPTISLSHVHPRYSLPLSFSSQLETVTHMLCVHIWIHLYICMSIYLSFWLFIDLMSVKYLFQTIWYSKIKFCIRSSNSGRISSYIHWDLWVSKPGPQGLRSAQPRWEERWGNQQPQVNEMRATITPEPLYPCEEQWWHWMFIIPECPEWSKFYGK
jgi:hypothetical protein